jgi:hypothetical protein
MLFVPIVYWVNVVDTWLALCLTSVTLCVGVIGSVMLIIAMFCSAVIGFAFLTGSADNWFWSNRLGRR